MLTEKVMHPPARGLEQKCIVCGCTDSSACEEGCTWALIAPPVCSSCVNAYLNAKLWAVLFAFERRGASGKRVSVEVMESLKELRTLYALIASGNAGNIPTLKEVTRINRGGEKWQAKHGPVR